MFEELLALKLLRTPVLRKQVKNLLKVNKSELEYFRLDGHEFDFSREN